MKAYDEDSVTFPVALSVKQFVLLQPKGRQLHVRIEPHKNGVVKLFMCAKKDKEEFENVVTQH